MFDARFAKNAALTLVAVGLIVLWPLWVGAARFIVDGEVARNFSALIAIQLAVAGLAVAFGGLYLALLEFRARAQAAAELADQTAEPATRGLVAEAVKAAPEILKAFGQLKPVAALLAIAAFLFLCATVLAWRGLDG